MEPESPLGVIQPTDQECDAISEVSVHLKETKGQEAAIRECYQLDSILNHREK